MPSVPTSFLCNKEVCSDIYWIKSLVKVNSVHVFANFWHNIFSILTLDKHSD